MKRPSKAFLTAAAIACLQASLAGGAHAQTFLTSLQGAGTTGAPFIPYNWGSYGEPWGSAQFWDVMDLSAFPKKDLDWGTVNGFYDASRYAADCSAPLYILKNPGGYASYNPNYGYSDYVPPRQVPLCSATSVPVVDASFLGKLAAAGIEYHLAYPIANNGNGRAYVVWLNFNGSRGSGLQAEYNPQRGLIAFLGPVPASDGVVRPAIAGYARIEGVGWQNQFQAYTHTDVSTVGGNVSYATTTIAHGDSAGDFIASLPSPRRETTIRLEMPMCWIQVDGCNVAYEVTMVTDDWLAGQPTPPTPPPTPLQQAAAPPPAAPASPTNLPGPSAPAGDGTPGGDTAGDGDGGAFDWEAYCRMPNADGTPKPAAWVQNCLATGH